MPLIQRDISPIFGSVGGDVGVDSGVGGRATDGDLRTVLRSRLERFNSTAKLPFSSLAAFVTGGGLLAADYGLRV